MSMGLEDFKSIFDKINPLHIKYYKFINWKLQERDFKYFTQFYQRFCNKLFIGGPSRAWYNYKDLLENLKSITRKQPDGVTEAEKQIAICNKETKLVDNEIYNLDYNLNISFHSTEKFKINALQKRL